MIDRKVIIELKAVESLNDVHLAQMMTYLRLSGCRLGLLINFNVTLLKNGIRLSSIIYKFFCALCAFPCALCV